MRDLLSKIIKMVCCDKSTRDPSFGKAIFWITFYFCLRNFKDFNEWWLAMLALELTYIFGTKFMPSFLVSKFQPLEMTVEEPGE